MLKDHKPVNYYRWLCYRALCRRWYARFARYFFHVSEHYGTHLLGHVVVGAFHFLVNWLYVWDYNGNCGKGSSNGRGSRQTRLLRFHMRSYLLVVTHPFKLPPKQRVHTFVLFILWMFVLMCSYRCVLNGTDIS